MLVLLPLPRQSLPQLKYFFEVLTSFVKIYGNYWNEIKLSIFDTVIKT